MSEKFIVTNYYPDDFSSMIKEAFREELKEILKHEGKADEYDVMLSRKEVSELFNLSLITLSKYQRKGKESCHIVD